MAALALFAAAQAPAQEKRVFEMRTYTSVEGKLDAVVARFRNHTTKLFEKHGIQNIGYWVPQDPPRSQNTLIYIVAHPSREAAKKAWDAFRADPAWLKAQNGIGSRREDRPQDRVGLHGSRGLLQAEVAYFRSTFTMA